VTTTTKAMRRALLAALVVFAAVSVGGSVPRARAGQAGPATPALSVPPGALGGIDVSHWQNAIDWSLVADGGVSFAIAKATQGRSYVDPMYDANKAGAAEAGIPFTAYHFAEPDDSYRDAVKEANHFVAVAALGPGNLVPALDLERTGGLSQRDLTRWVLGWLGRVKELLGVRPMVYTGPNGWIERTGGTTAIADAGYTVLWLAHWNVSTPTVPGADWGDNGWTFWQFSDCLSVPGIDGCVDGDWFGGPSLDGVTMRTTRTLDVTPPAATISTPSDLGASVVVSFSEPVRHVTPATLVLSRPDVARIVPAGVACSNPLGDRVDCWTGPVRTALMRPDEPPIAAQAYGVAVAPAGVSPVIEDRAGNALTEVDGGFITPPGVEQDSQGIAYAWRDQRSRRALGGSYEVEHLTGARYVFPFDGRSITWYTVAGPAQGQAEVFVDGRSQGVFDQYAPRQTFAVARRFSGLPAGGHTLVVQALGRAARAAVDAQVAIDGFDVGGTLVREPAPAMRWRTADVAGASGGTVAVTDVPGASASFTLHGTGVRWTTVRGPSQGRAAIYVDGELVRTVDNYAETPTPNVVRTVDGLIIGVHTVQIVALGDARARARGAFVTVDRLAVVP